MTWRVIAHKTSPTQDFIAAEGEKTVETYRRKYDEGQGALAQRRNWKKGGFDLLWEDNKPPFKRRKPDLRFYGRKRRF
mgnify:FL=1